MQNKRAFCVVILYVMLLHRARGPSTRA